MIQLITDSTCDLEPEVLKEHNIGMVPLYVQFGSKSYKDGVNLSKDDFFAKLESYDSIPTTSQPTVGDFLSVYEKHHNEGKSIISLHISGKLSGAVNAARTARTLFLEDYEDAKITVIDSFTTTLALGGMVTSAARLISEGLSHEEIVENIEKFKTTTGIVFSVGDLRHLQRGGRIGKAAAFFGGLISIVPLLCVENGEVTAGGKTIGTDRAISWMIESLKKRVAAAPISVISTMTGKACAEEEKLYNMIKSEFPDLDVKRNRIGAVIGTHVGSSAFGITWH